MKKALRINVTFTVLALIAIAPSVVAQGKTVIRMAKSPQQFGDHYIGESDFGQVSYDGEIEFKISISQLFGELVVHESCRIPKSLPESGQNINFRISGPGGGRFPYFGPEAYTITADKWSNFSGAPPNFVVPHEIIEMIQPMKFKYALEITPESGTGLEGNYWMLGEYSGAQPLPGDWGFNVPGSPSLDSVFVSLSSSAFWSIDVQDIWNAPRCEKDEARSLIQLILGKERDSVSFGKVHIWDISFNFNSAFHQIRQRYGANSLDNLTESPALAFSSSVLGAFAIAASSGESSEIPRWTQLIEDINEIGVLSPKSSLATEDAEKIMESWALKRMPEEAKEELKHLNQMLVQGPNSLNNDGDIVAWHKEFKRKLERYLEFVTPAIEMKSFAGSIYYQLYSKLLVHLRQDEMVVVHVVAKEELVFRWNETLKLYLTQYPPGATPEEEAEIDKRIEERKRQKEAQEMEQLEKIRAKLELKGYCLTPLPFVFHDIRESKETSNYSPIRIQRSSGEYSYIFVRKEQLESLRKKLRDSLKVQWEIPDSHDLKGRFTERFELLFFEDRRSADNEIVTTGLVQVGDGLPEE